MKRLFTGFILTFVGAVLLCTSFVLAAETPEPEGIIQDEEKVVLEAILGATEGTETSTPYSSPTGRNKRARRRLGGRCGDCILSL